MTIQNATKATKVTKAQIIAAGRAHLRAWLTAAEAHGTIYYAIPRVARSGMSRQIVLSTIVTGRDGKPELSRLWPGLPDDVGGPLAGDAYRAALDTVARDWRFSFDARAFKIGGCGMDMVFALVDDLAGQAGMDAKYPNRVNREAF
jgi:hypothetical protein